MRLNILSNCRRDNCPDCIDKKRHFHTRTSSLSVRTCHNPLLDVWKFKYLSFFIFDIPKYYFVGELSSDMSVNCLQFCRWTVSNFVGELSPKYVSVNSLVGELSRNLFKRESRQFIDKTTHRHGFWRQFIDTIEDNSSTLFEDNSSTHLFEYNLQS